MKLIRIEFAGIGPFSGKETIDFTRFDDSGLFLLEGPTGAGKSTILDAITFALYGIVARGSDSTKDRLRSDHVPAKAKSYVELVFEVSEGFFKVYREPTYIPEGNKTARNGQLTLIQVHPVESADGHFTYVDGDPIGRNAAEMNQWITQAVGLTKDQFVQTVVLPQGKFADFLMAKSEQREALLKDIFNTHLFTTFQKKLAEVSKQHSDDVVEAEREVTRRFSDLESLYGHLQDFIRPADADSSHDSPFLASQDSPSSFADVDPLDPDSQQASTLAITLAQSAHRVCDEEEAKLPGLIDIAEACHRELEATRALNSLVEERMELQSHLEMLMEHALIIDQYKKRHSDALIASSLSGPVRQFTDARDYMSVKNTELLTAHRQLRSRFTTLSHIEEDSLSSHMVDELLEELSTIVEALSAKKATLENLTSLEQELSNEREEQEALTASLAVLTQKRTQLEDQLSQLPKMRESALQGRENMLKDLELFATGERDMALLQPRYQAACEVAEHIEILKIRAKNIQSARRRAQEANIASLQAHMRWMDHASGSLAAQLEDGKPCPVCGSVEHPAPARIDQTDAVTLEDLDAVDQARSKAEQELNEAHMLHAQTNQAIASGNTIARADKASLELEIKNAQERIDKHSALSQTIKELDQALAELEQNISRVKDELAETKVEIGKAQSQHSSLAQSIDTKQARCEEGRGTFESIEAHLANVSDSLTDARTHHKHLQEWNQSYARLETTTNALTQALTDSPCASIEEALAFVDSHFIAGEELRALKDQIDSHQSDLQITRNQLLDKRLANVADRSVQSTAALEEADTNATAARDAMQHRCGQLSALVGQIDDAHTHFKTAVAELDHVRAEVAPYQRLVNIVNGGSLNLSSTPLSSWVLVSRLNEVLDATNPRLSAFSGGRYQLICRPEDGTRSKKSGLGLAIHDLETDHIRKTQTLSGGETFYTSLALALGLVDIVTAESGGTEIKSMFIDEGFGSLDSDTRDVVMHHLHALRQSGRTVGVISHVEEMSKQISDQIHVRPKANGGSSLSIDF